MKRFKHITLLLAIALMASCSKNDDSGDTPIPDEENNYIMVIQTDAASGSGMLVPFSSIPSGDIEVSEITNGIQLNSTTTTGITHNGAYYHSSNTAGEIGIQKFSLNESGSFVAEGFLPTKGQYQNGNSFGFVSDTKGYYSNDDLSQTSLQIFDPETMQRTGEIDCSAEINNIKSELNNVVATRLGGFLVERDGKAFTAVYFMDADGNQVVDKFYVAVIDVTTDSIDKIIAWDDFIYFGYGVMNSGYVNIDEKGDLYLSGTFGLFTDPEGIGYRTIRIKSGSTDFDANWNLHTTRDWSSGENFGIGGLAHNGKLYVKMLSETLSPTFEEVREKICYTYEIDIETKTPSKVDDIPVGYWKSAYGPTLIDDKPFILVENDDEGKVYIYSYDTDSKTATREITVLGGQPTQFIKL